MKRILVIAALLATALIANAQSANDLIKKAQSEARSSHRNVLIIFHASWCGWCKRFETLLENPEFKKDFDSNFVIVRLDVLENPDKKSLETPGGIDVMKKLGGEKAGLPFFAMTDPTGKVLADSLMRVPGKAEGQNIGCPAAPEEVEHFAKMLSKGAPKMGDGSVRKMKDWIKAQKWNG